MQQDVAAPDDALTYADGNPHDRIEFFDAKSILKPDLFYNIRGFKSFSELVGEAATKVKGASLRAVRSVELRPRIREVMFLDTADFRLYNNSYILRRRTAYQDGFPIEDPEIVFKFRNPDMRWRRRSTSGRKSADPTG